MIPLNIPASHQALLESGTACAALTTIMPDGQPQTTPVWCNHDGEYVYVNTMRGFQKEKNMRANPKVTLLLFELKAPGHCLEIRGEVVEMTEDGALEHLNTLTSLYMHRPNAQFFGDSIPVEYAVKHIPVKVKIALSYLRVEG